MAGASSSGKALPGPARCHFCQCAFSHLPQPRVSLSTDQLSLDRDASWTGFLSKEAYRFVAASCLSCIAQRAYRRRCCKPPVRRDIATSLPRWHLDVIKVGLVSRIIFIWLSSPEILHDPPLCVLPCQQTTRLRLAAQLVWIVSRCYEHGAPVAGRVPF